MIQRRQTSVSALIERKTNKDCFQKENISLLPAQNFSQKVDAYSLGFEEYAKKGYINNNQLPFLINDYDFESDTVVLNCYLGDTLAGTTTITAPHAMPTRQLFPSLIPNHYRMTEVSRLAIDEKFKNNKKILWGLIDMIFTASMHHFHYDQIFIEVNPRHVSFYEKLLNFTAISHQVIGSPLVNNAPAVLMCLELELKNINKRFFPLTHNLISNKNFLTQLEISLANNPLLIEKTRNLRDNAYAS